MRLDHVNCLLWYVPTNQFRKMNRLPSCKYCTNLIYYLRRKVNLRRSLTEQQKKARLEPSLHCPIYSLSPASQSKILRKSRITINRLKQRIPQLQTCNVMLNDESHYELLTLVSSIQKKSEKDLQKILQEADQAGKGEVLRQCWRQDVQERQQYTMDQKRNGKLIVALEFFFLHLGLTLVCSNRL